MSALISWSTAERTRIPQISHVTARLVREAFTLEDLGRHSLKGVTEPMPVFRALGSTEDHEDEVGAVGVPFLVGRDEETGLLLRRWEQAKEGLGDKWCWSLGCWLKPSGSPCWWRGKTCTGPTRSHVTPLTLTRLERSQVEAGVSVVAEALALVEQTGVRWYEAET
jgi:hypothetical protein